MSRLEVSRDLKVSESWLRALEAKGFVPEFSEVASDAYVERVRLIVAARAAGMSLQRVRREFIRIATEALHA